MYVCRRTNGALIMELQSSCVGEQTQESMHAIFICREITKNSPEMMQCCVQGLYEDTTVHRIIEN